MVANFDMVLQRVELAIAAGADELHRFHSARENAIAEDAEVGNGVDVVQSRLPSLLLSAPVLQVCIPALHHPGQWKFGQLE